MCSLGVSKSIDSLTKIHPQSQSKETARKTTIMTRSSAAWLACFAVIPTVFCWSSTYYCSVPVTLPGAKTGCQACLDAMDREVWIPAFGIYMSYPTWMACVDTNVNTLCAGDPYPGPVTPMCHKTQTDCTGDNVTLYSNSQCTSVATGYENVLNAPYWECTAKYDAGTSTTTDGVNCSEIIPGTLY